MNSCVAEPPLWEGKRNKMAGSGVEAEAMVVRIVANRGRSGGVGPEAELPEE